MHTRNEQVIRAFKIDLDNSKGGKVECPLCEGIAHKDQIRFLEHVRRIHGEQIWTTVESDAED